MLTDTPPATPADSFRGWAIVEVMGHKKYAGLVGEQLIAGAALVRVDIPDTAHRLGYTKLIGVGSIYAITPVEEALARRAAEQIERYDDPLPVYIPEARQLVAATTTDAEILDDQDDDDEGPF